MSKASAPALLTPINETDHLRGPADAAVTLLEYGDYQCPHCGRAFPIVEQLLKEHSDKLRVAFRHFPLMKAHPRAKSAAEAAEASAPSGKFWDMHALLFLNQNALEPADLLVYAETIGLDLEQFQKDLAEHTYGRKVTNDLAGGIRSGVNGTPSFFINGIRHNGSYDHASLDAAIRQALG